MKRIVLALILIGVSTVVYLFVGRPLIGPAAAAFGQSSLSGVYRVVASEVDLIPNTTPPQYLICNQIGGANFDGIGTVTISGTQRCNVGVGGTAVNSAFSFQGPYCVNTTNGGFVVGTGGLSQPCTFDPIHGRIVGEVGSTQTLLLDGTRRNLNVIVYMGVAIPISTAP